MSQFKNAYKFNRNKNIVKNGQVMLLTQSSIIGEFTLILKVTIQNYQFC